MHRHPVDSSSIAAIGYDSTERVLEVEFKHSAVYQYLDVPGDVFEAFLTANSKGTFFNSDIKNKYEFARVTPFT